MGSQEISDKTFADIILAARYKSNDNESPYFSDDDEMLEWANEGHRQAALDSACIQATEQIDLTSNVIEYDIVNAYHRIHSVVYKVGNNYKALIKGSPARIGHIANDEPVEYYEFDGKLGVYPALSDRTTEVVKLYESKRTFPDRELTDNLETPSLLDNGIMWFIIAQHHWKDKKFSAHAQAMAKFDAEVYKARTEFYPGFSE
jgi:hypothetical protein